MKEKNSGVSLRAIAVVTKVFGVQGEVKIRSYLRERHEYEDLPLLMTGKDERSASVRVIEKIVERHGSLYVTFQGVNDRKTSEKLVGHYLFVDEANRKKLPQGSFFIDELIGLHVVNLQQQPLGTVTDILSLPGQKVYVVRTDRGDVLVPAVSEIIRSIDTANKLIVIDPPDDLFV